MNNNETMDLIGCCGINCALCTKYQSKSQSRCLGCRLGEQHSWCSIWNCCVKKKDKTFCTECNEIFKCDIHSRRKVIEWQPAATNLKTIQEKGLKELLKEQKARTEIINTFIEKYNDGRSMSFYCRASTKLSIDNLKKALIEAERIVDKEHMENNNIMKERAEILKKILLTYAREEKIEIE